MPLIHEHPNDTYVLRAANGQFAWINDQCLQHSFLLTPQQLITSWAPTQVQTLRADDLAAVLALSPDIVILGTGEQHVLLPPALQALCLTRGVGIETMANPAAARTYTILAAEQRRVVLAMLLSNAPQATA